MERRTLERVCCLGIQLFGAGVKNIIDRVVSSYGDAVGVAAKERLSKYIRLLASAGIVDEEQLVTFGHAYLKEFLQPDPTYTGC
jgi:hypothetical protein